MPHPTIPARVLAGALASICDSRAAQLAQRADRPPRQSPDPARARSHAEGRRREAAALREQRGRLYALVAHGRGQVDAATAGLLCALAQGHMEAARALEDYLAAAGHPAADAVTELPAADVATWLETILARQRGRA